jgi:hypothetical protein
MKYANQLTSRNTTAYNPRVATSLAIVFMLLSGLSYAQGYIEGANISYEVMPMKIKTPDGDQNFTGNNFKIGTTVPIFLTTDKSKYILVGGNLEAFTFAGSHPAFEVSSVYSISPTLGYSTMVNSKFNLTGLFMPTMNSDYKNIKGSDIKFAAIVRGSWKVNDNLTWKATLGYRRQFYGPQYIALVGLDWKATDRWRIFGDLPLPPVML